MKVVIPKYKWKLFKLYTKKHTIHNDTLYTANCFGDEPIKLICEPYFVISKCIVSEYSEDYYTNAYKKYENGILSKRPIVLGVHYSKKVGLQLHEFLIQCNTIASPRYCTIATVRDNVLYIVAVRAIPRVLSLICKTFVKIPINASTFVGEPQTEYNDLSEDNVLLRYKHSQYTKLITNSNIYAKEYSIEKMRTTLKHNVADTISTMAKVDTDCVNEIVSGWAESSIGHQSLCLQRAVANIFGIKHCKFFEDAKKWKMDTTNINHYSVAQAIYENTQQHLKKNNITKVFLYRGLTLNDAVSHIVGKRSLRGFNPLSSFSNCYDTAYEFTSSCNIGQFRDKTFPFILGGWFPPSLIFSTPLTGIGCHLELEFVVLGGEHSVIVDPLIFTSIKCAFEQNYDVGTRVTSKIENYEPQRILTERDEPITKQGIKEIAKILRTDTDTVIQAAQGKEVQYTVGLSSGSINVDDNVENADWCKQSWDLPTYGSKAFDDYLKRSKMSLDEFKLLPVYKHALRKGLIREN